MIGLIECIFLRQQMKLMNFVLKIFSACALLATTSLAAAASITYYVERFMPASTGRGVTYSQATVSGSVTTNGKIGTLSSADILSFNFSVSFPGETRIIQSPALAPNGVLQSVSLTSVVADSTTLSLLGNLSSGSLGYFLVVDETSLARWEIAVADVGPSVFKSYESAQLNPTSMAPFYSQALGLLPNARNYTFASTAPAAVPLPSSLALVAPLMMFALRRHRRV
jgi:hypothetical protein